MRHYDEKDPPSSILHLHLAIFSCIVLLTESYCTLILISINVSISIIIYSITIEKKEKKEKTNFFSYTYVYITLLHVYYNLHFNNYIYNNY